MRVAQTAVGLPPNRLFDTDAQGRPRLRRSYSLAAGQLPRYAAGEFRG
jgi:hypothetical protein